MEAKAAFSSRNILHVLSEVVPITEASYQPRSGDAFTDRIGCHDAALLRRVDMDLPTTVKKPDGDFEIKASSLEVLRHLQARCLD